jgi:hypothetical protein
MEREEEEEGSEEGSEEGREGRGKRSEKSFPRFLA